VRFETNVIAAVVMVPIVLTQISANALAKDPPWLPYDPYPWCAQYGGMEGGGTNCGFLTIEQCRATVSGVGGFCVPNQFYNPGRPASPSRKQRR
jgi:Protein of unknown function (DUF3551)